MVRGRVTAVMSDTVDLEGSVSFWCDALDLKVAGRAGNYVYLEPISEGGPHLAFQQVPDDRQGKNRMHLDIAVADRSAFAEWVESRGGATVGEVNEAGFPPWLVMVDPSGNEFCIYEGREAN